MEEAQVMAVAMGDSPERVDSVVLNRVLAEGPVEPKALRSSYPAVVLMASLDRLLAAGKIRQLQDGRVRVPEVEG